MRTRLIFIIHLLITVSAFLYIRIFSLLLLFSVLTLLLIKKSPSSDVLFAFFLHDLPIDLISRRERTRSTVRHRNHSCRRFHQEREATRIDYLAPCQSITAKHDVGFVVPLAHELQLGKRKTVTPRDDDYPGADLSCTATEIRVCSLLLLESLLSPACAVKLNYLRKTHGARVFGRYFLTLCVPIDTCAVLFCSLHG